MGNHFGLFYTVFEFRFVFQSRADSNTTVALPRVLAVSLPAPFTPTTLPRSRQARERVGDSLDSCCRDPIEERRSFAELFTRKYSTRWPQRVASCSDPRGGHLGIARAHGWDIVPLSPLA